MCMYDVYLVLGYIYSVYVIAWFAVVFGVSSMSNAETIVQAATILAIV